MQRTKLMYVASVSLTQRVHRVQMLRFLCLTAYILLCICLNLDEHRALVERGRKKCVAGLHLNFIIIFFITFATVSQSFSVTNLIFNSQFTHSLRVVDYFVSACNCLFQHLTNF